MISAQSFGQRGRSMRRQFVFPDRARQSFALLWRRKNPEARRNRRYRFVVRRRNFFLAAESLHFSSALASAPLGIVATVRARLVKAANSLCRCVPPDATLGAIAAVCPIGVFPTLNVKASRYRGPRRSLQWNRTRRFDRMRNVVFTFSNAAWHQHLLARADGVSSRHERCAKRRAQLTVARNHCASMVFELQIEA